MSLRPQLAVLIMVSGCTLCNQAPSKAEIGFSQIVTNETTPASAIALMGQAPSRRSQTQWLNLIDVQIIEFDDGKNEYLLTVGGLPIAGLAPRVLAKEMRPRKTTND